MTHTPPQNNVINEPPENFAEGHEQGEILEEFDTDAWVATGEMLQLPTNIFKSKTLSPSCRKSILQSEPRNKDISFEPPVMDKKIWTSMPRYAKDQDKMLRKMAYKISSAIRPIDNTLRIVYSSKPESEEGDQYKAWVQLEQSVLNTRALVLDSLSYTNELRREQALKSTISPTYQKPSGKEEVFGEELNETVRLETEVNKLLNDAFWQKKRSIQSKSQPASLNFKLPQSNSYSRRKNKFNQGKSQHWGNKISGGQQQQQQQQQSRQSQ